MLQLATPSPLERDLRASLAVGSLALEIARADAALKSQPMPETLSDLHSRMRERYQDAALEAVMRLNLDADLFALRQASYQGFETFTQFCKDEDLDWLADTHPANKQDKLECLLTTITNAAIQRWRNVLSGVYPGLQRYLARMEQNRATDTDPNVGEEQ